MTLHRSVLLSKYTSDYLQKNTTQANKTTYIVPAVCLGTIFDIPQAIFFGEVRRKQNIRYQTNFIFHPHHHGEFATPHYRPSGTSFLSQEVITHHGPEVAMDPPCRSRFCLFLSDPDPGSKICEKQDPDPESNLNFGSNRSLRGYFISKNMCKFPLDR